MTELVAAGRELERGGGGQRVPRHHHACAYVALVLSGSYVETGDRGRIKVAEGDVLFHDAFDGHADHFASNGAAILNLPLSHVPANARGRCGDPDAIARLARIDLAAAAELLVASTEVQPDIPLDWPDFLAAAIRDDPLLRLENWARLQELAPTSVSRGFRLAYGISPKRFRFEQRAAAAARAIRSGTTLLDAAFDNGFSDQPHMTRAHRSLFGFSPGKLRH